jgi:hypothetical protein
MRPFPPVAIFAVFLLSCSGASHTVKEANDNHMQLEAISKRLFSQFSQLTFITPNQLDSLGLSDSDIRFLRYTLKCPYAQIVYHEKKLVFFPADSVVIFTRTGLNILGSEQDIVIDMRQTIRDSIPIPAGQYTKYYPIRKGMYYFKGPMPEL